MSVGVNIMCGSAALSDNWTCFCCRQERRSRAVQKHPTTFSEHSLLARANAVAAASHQVQRLGKSSGNGSGNDRGNGNGKDEIL